MSKKDENNDKATIEHLKLRLDASMSELTAMESVMSENERLKKRIKHISESMMNIRRTVEDTFAKNEYLKSNFDLVNTSRIDDLKDELKRADRTHKYQLKEKDKEIKKLSRDLTKIKRDWMKLHKATKPKFESTERH